MGHVFLRKNLDPGSYFKDLVALDKEVDKVKRFCDFVWSQDWSVSSKTLRFMPTILLYGPPGTGKTTLLRNLACSMKSEGLEYYRENLDLLANKDLGETSKAIESLFVTIKERAQCGSKVLLHLDDVDSILASRSQANESSGIRRAVNTFITQLDDLMLEVFEFPPIIAASTNMFDFLDVAIRRRFSLKVKINPELVESYLKGLVLPLVKICEIEEDIDYSALALLAQENKLTPNDVIRIFQDLYLLGRGGQPVSESVIRNAFINAESSMGSDDF